MHPKTTSSAETARAVSKERMEELDLGRGLDCEEDAHPESVVNAGLVTESRSHIRTFIVEPSHIHAYKSVDQLCVHYGSVEAPVYGMNNLDSFGKHGIKNLSSRMRHRILTQVSHRRISEPQPNLYIGDALARDYRQLRKAQAQLKSEIHHVSRKQFHLQPHKFQEVAVVLGKSYMTDLKEEISGTYTSQPHQLSEQGDTDVSLIAGLELSLKKFYGTRQEIAEGAEDLWGMMIQANVEGDDFPRPANNLKSGSTLDIDSLDGGILNFLWCHKSVFWQNDFVKSLEILRKRTNVEASQKYYLGLETARGVNKARLKVLKWLRSQKSLSWAIEYTPEKIRSDRATNGYEALRFPFDLCRIFQDYRSSGSNGSVTSGDIFKGRYADVSEMFSIDGPFDTRSPAVAAKASHFYLKKEALESEALSSLLVNSMKIISSGIAAEEGGRGWDLTGLLQVTDRIREECEDAPLSTSDLVLIECILRDILKREPYERISISYSDIMFSRIDKLLNLVNGMKGRNLSKAKNLQQVIDLISLVELSWHRRFAGRVSDIDEDRVKILLHKVRFERSSKSGHLRLISEIKSHIPIEEVQLELGKWWSNSACVYRDVFLKSLPTDRVSPIPTILLLNGIEIYDKAAECLRYIREGPLQDLILSLQTKVGKTIRLLRGYKLKSLLAPEAGIRYDGRYYLGRYGHEYADQQNGIFRMTLWYKQVSDQPTLGSDALLHKPSIKDEWQLYKKAEDEEMRKVCTPIDYASWRALEEIEIMECKKWRNEQALKEQKESELYPRRLIQKNGVLY